MRVIIRAFAFGIGLAVLSPVEGPAEGQQPPPDPLARLGAEYEARRLADEHFLAALNQTIAAYEARLQTAMQWLKAAQTEAAETPPITQPENR